VNINDHGQRLALLEAAGVKFIDGNGVWPCVRLRKTLNLQAQTTPTTCDALEARRTLLQRSARVGTGFNSLAQPPKSLSDDLFGVILPYPFLQRRRKRQRFAGFETE
jgi:hypothetical protein